MNFACFILLQDQEIEYKIHSQEREKGVLVHLLSAVLISAFLFSNIVLIQVDNLAAGLLAMGLKRGDRVGIWGPNMREWVITQFATAKAGLILVSTNCQ